jgi:hypothetical protein
MATLASAVRLTLPVPLAILKFFLHPLLVLLAERFGADNGRIARIILVSSAAAFVTFSMAVSLLT